MLKRWLLILSILLSTGCSQKPTIKYIYKTTPNELLNTPCVAVRHGDGSVKQLANAYVENLGCIKKYEVLLDSVREYNTKMRGKE